MNVDLFSLNIDDPILGYAIPDAYCPATGFDVARFAFRAEGSTHPLPVPRGTGFHDPKEF